MNLKDFFYKKVSYQFPWADENTYSLFGGALRLKASSRGCQDLRLLGLRLFKKQLKGHNMISKVFCLPFYKENLMRKFLDSLLPMIDEKYDGIYIIRHNIGESYIYLAHLKDWVKANGTKKPLLIVWQEKYIPFYKMFLPKNVSIKYISINKNCIQDALDNEQILYNGRRIFCPTPSIAENINRIYDTDKSANFYDYICKDFGRNNKLSMQCPKIDKITKLRMSKKISDFLKRPFVILLPFATSLSDMSDAFWNILIKEFNRIGYDVFINNGNDENSSVFTDVVSFDTNVAEIFTLAEESAGIIGLASGLSVLLTAAKRPMDLIYTDFRVFNPRISSERIKHLYSVHNLPGVSALVREYAAEDFTEMQLVQKIISKYKKRVNRD